LGNAEGMETKGVRSKNQLFKNTRSVEKTNKKQKLSLWIKKKMWSKQKNRGLNMCHNRVSEGGGNGVLVGKGNHYRKNRKRDRPRGERASVVLQKRFWRVQEGQMREWTKTQRRRKSVTVGRKAAHRCLGENEKGFTSDPAGGNKK